jgi:hypothetical protein
MSTVVRKRVLICYLHRSPIFVRAHLDVLERMLFRREHDELRGPQQKLRRPMRLPRTTACLIRDFRTIEDARPLYTRGMLLMAYVLVAMGLIGNCGAAKRGRSIRCISTGDDQLVIA